MGSSWRISEKSFMVGRDVSEGAMERTWRVPVTYRKTTKRTSVAPMTRTSSKLLLTGRCRFFLGVFWRWLLSLVVSGRFTFRAAGRMGLLCIMIGNVKLELSLIYDRSNHIMSSSLLRLYFLLLDSQQIFGMRTNRSEKIVPLFSCASCECLCEHVQF